MDETYSPIRQATRVALVSLYIAIETEYAFNRAHIRNSNVPKTIKLPVRACYMLNNSHNNNKC